tara:strand:- start:1547 stop:2842 length:1296 start_codon:yes stop_codon:yes gene_type:complete
MNKVIFQNARIVDPDLKIDILGSLIVEDKKIVGIEDNKRISSDLSDYKVINCKKFVLCPGFVDIKCHLRVPGEEYKEDFFHASRSAAAAGITSLICMPNTNPIIDNVSMVELLQRKARKESAVKIYSTAALTRELKGKEICEIGLLQEAGAVAFTDAIKAIEDPVIMMRALKYAKAFDALIMQHPQDYNLSKNGYMNAGLLSTKLGIKGIPIEAEVIQIERDIRLTEMTKGKIHFLNVTSKESVEIIEKAQRKGINVSCSTSPHYFNLTEEDIRKWRTFAKLSPPLRNRENIKGIKQGLVNKVIHCISSDHSPHDTDSKRLPFEQASSGIIGFESLLPLTLKFIYEKKLDITRLVELLSSNPAKLMGLNAGSLKKGKPADLVIFNPEKEVVLGPKVIKSKSNNFPYEKLKANGKVMLTMIDGKIIYNDRSF